jgi:hypothetical protein
MPCMDKKLSGLDGPVLQIATCMDLLEKLREDGRRLEGTWHPYDAFNFVVTAWHLQNDWLSQRGAPKPMLAAEKHLPKRLPPEMRLVLDVLRDLANGSKHQTLEQTAADKRVVAQLDSGRTAGYYSYYFRERMIGVTTTGGYIFSIRKLRNFSLAYFDWVFDDTRPVRPFPGELIWGIWRCNPANRVASAVPPSGATPGKLGDPGFVTKAATGA